MIVWMYANPTPQDNSVIKTFTVHETILRAQSPFFENAMARDWKEATEHEVKLPEHTPNFFEVYSRWAYSNRITVNKLDVIQEARIAYCSILCRAYILGDTLQDTDFKDAIIDVLVSYTDTAHWACLHEAKYIYGNTMYNAPLWRWFVAYIVHYGFGIQFSLEQLHAYHTIEFLRHILVRIDSVAVKKMEQVNEDELRNLRGFQPSFAKMRENTCLLHEHGDQVCYMLRGVVDEKLYKATVVWVLLSLLERCQTWALWEIRIEGWGPWSWDLGLEVKSWVSWTALIIFLASSIY